MITLDHGSGGRAAGSLIEELFLRHLKDEELARLEDAAILELGGGRLAFTTDTYVVDPLFFPGGNIGHLAVHGTINDLAVRGARPYAMSLAFVVEEGLGLDVMEEVVATVAVAAEGAGVRVVTGDTKVVPRGKGGGLFINTSGVGLVEAAVAPSVHRLAPGDAILVSGPIGQHGMAIMASRAGVELTEGHGSDTAPIWGLVETLLQGVGAAVHAMRDPTRGGLATVLCEMAEASGVALRIDEAAIPVPEWVEGLSRVMGLDPFYLANEGRLVAAVAGEAADAALAIMRRHPLGRESVVIGRVVPGRRGEVLCRTAAGGQRPLRRLHGHPMPRIC